MAQGCTEIPKLSFSDKTLTLSSAYWLNDFTLKHCAFSKLDSILFNRIKKIGMLHAIWWLECTEIDRNRQKLTTTPLNEIRFLPSLLSEIERAAASNHTSNENLYGSSTSVHASSRAI